MCSTSSRDLNFASQSHGKTQVHHTVCLTFATIHWRQWAWIKARQRWERHKTREQIWQRRISLWYLQGIGPGRIRDQRFDESCSREDSERPAEKSGIFLSHFITSAANTVHYSVTCVYIWIRCIESDLSIIIIIIKKWIWKQRPTSV